MRCLNCNKVIRDNTVECPFCGQEDSCNLERLLTGSLDLDDPEASDNTCPCCEVYDYKGEKGDYKPGMCFRCGWSEGMPAVGKELPDRFDEDWEDWRDRAYPKERSE